MIGQNTSENGSHATDPSSIQPLTYSIVAQLLPLALIIVIVNSLVVALFWKRSQLRTPQNYFLLGLALSDLLTGLVNIPLIIAFFLGLTRSDLTIFFIPVFHNFLAVLAAYQIMAITAEKYMAIQKPLKHRLFGNKKARRVLAVIWLVSALVALFPFCFYDKRKDMDVWKKAERAHNIFCIVAVFLVPYAFMIYAQCVMFKTISRSGLLAITRANELQLDQRRAQKKMKTERKCLVLFASMAAIYAICWLPWFVISLLLGIYDSPALEGPAKAFAIIRYLSSIINPLIYTFFKKDFRNAFKVLVLKKPVSRGFNQATLATSV